MLPGESSHPYMHSGADMSYQQLAQQQQQAELQRQYLLGMQYSMQQALASQNGTQHLVGIAPYNPVQQLVSAAAGTHGAGAMLLPQLGAAPTSPHTAAALAAAMTAATAPLTRLQPANSGAAAQQPAGVGSSRPHPGSLAQLQLTSPVSPQAAGRLAGMKFLVTPGGLAALAGDTGATLLNPPASIASSSGGIVPGTSDRPKSASQNGSTSSGSNKQMLGGRWTFKAPGAAAGAPAASTAAAAAAAGALAAEPMDLDTAAATRMVSQDLSAAMAVDPSAPIHLGLGEDALMPAGSSMLAEALAAAAAAAAAAASIPPEPPATAINRPGSAACTDEQVICGQRGRSSWLVPNHSSAPASDSHAALAAVGSPATLGTLAVKAAIAAAAAAAQQGAAAAAAACAGPQLPAASQVTADGDAICLVRTLPGSTKGPSSQAEPLAQQDMAGTLSAQADAAATAAPAAGLSAAQPNLTLEHLLQANQVSSQQQQQQAVTEAQQQPQHLKDPSQQQQQQQEQPSKRRKREKLGPAELAALLASGRLSAFPSLYNQMQPTDAQLSQPSILSNNVSQYQPRQGFLQPAAAGSSRHGPQLDPLLTSSTPFLGSRSSSMALPGSRSNSMALPGGPNPSSPGPGPGFALGQAGQGFGSRPQGLDLSSPPSELRPLTDPHGRRSPPAALVVEPAGRAGGKDTQQFVAGSIAAADLTANTPYVSSQGLQAVGIPMPGLQGGSPTFAASPFNHQADFWPMGLFSTFGSSFGSAAAAAGGLAGGLGQLQIDNQQQHAGALGAGSFGAAAGAEEPAGIFSPLSAAAAASRSMLPAGPPKQLRMEAFPGEFGSVASNGNAGAAAGARKGRGRKRASTAEAPALGSAAAAGASASVRESQGECVDLAAAAAVAMAMAAPKAGRVRKGSRADPAAAAAAAVAAGMAAVASLKAPGSKHTDAPETAGIKPADRLAAAATAAGLEDHPGSRPNSKPNSKPNSRPNSAAGTCRSKKTATKNTSISAPKQDRSTSSSHQDPQQQQQQQQGVEQGAAATANLPALLHTASGAQAGTPAEVEGRCKQTAYNSQSNGAGTGTEAVRAAGAVLSDPSPADPTGVQHTVAAPASTSAAPALHTSSSHSAGQPTSASAKLAAQAPSGPALPAGAAPNTAAAAASEQQQRATKPRPVKRPAAALDSGPAGPAAALAAGDASAGNIIEDTCPSTDPSVAAAGGGGAGHEAGGSGFAARAAKQRRLTNSEAAAMAKGKAEAAASTAVHQPHAAGEDGMTGTRNVSLPASGTAATAAEQPAQQAAADPAGPAAAQGGVAGAAPTEPVSTAWDEFKAQATAAAAAAKAAEAACPRAPAPKAVSKPPKARKAPKPRPALADLAVAEAAAAAAAAAGAAAATTAGAAPATALAADASRRHGHSSRQAAAAAAAAIARNAAAAAAADEDEDVDVDDDSYMPPNDNHHNHHQHSSHPPASAAAIAAAVGAATAAAPGGGFPCPAAVAIAAKYGNESLPNIQYRASRGNRWQVYLSAQTLKYFYVGLYNTLAEAIHARDVAILAVHGYDAEIAVTLAPNSSYTQEEVVAVRMQMSHKPAAKAVMVYNGLWPLKNKAALLATDLAARPPATAAPAAAAAAGPLPANAAAAADGAGPAPAKQRAGKVAKKPAGSAAAAGPKPAAAQKTQKAPRKQRAQSEEAPKPARKGSKAGTVDSSTGTAAAAAAGEGGMSRTNTAMLDVLALAAETAMAAEHPGTEAPPVAPAVAPADAALEAAPGAASGAAASGAATETAAPAIAAAAGTAGEGVAGVGSGVEVKKALEAAAACAATGIAPAEAAGAPEGAVGEQLARAAAVSAPAQHAVAAASTGVKPPGALTVDVSGSDGAAALGPAAAAKARSAASTPRSTVSTPRGAATSAPAQHATGAAGTGVTPRGTTAATPSPPSAAAEGVKPRPWSGRAGSGSGGRSPLVIVALVPPAAPTEHVPAVAQMESPVPLPSPPAAAAAIEAQPGSRPSSAAAKKSEAAAAPRAAAAAEGDCPVAVQSKQVAQQGGKKSLSLPPGAAAAAAATWVLPTDKTGDGGTGNSPMLQGAGQGSQAPAAAAAGVGAGPKAAKLNSSNGTATGKPAASRLEGKAAVAAAAAALRKAPSNPKPAASTQGPLGNAGGGLGAEGGVAGGGELTLEVRANTSKLAKALAAVEGQSHPAAAATAPVAAAAAAAGAKAPTKSFHRRKTPPPPREDAAGAAAQAAKKPAAGAAAKKPAAAGGAAVSKGPQATGEAAAAAAAAALPAAGGPDDPTASIPGVRIRNRKFEAFLSDTPFRYLYLGQHSTLPAALAAKAAAQEALYGPSRRPSVPPVKGPVNKGKGAAAAAAAAAPAGASAAAGGDAVSEVLEVTQADAKAMAAKLMLGKQGDLVKQVMKQHGTWEALGRK